MKARRVYEFVRRQLIERGLTRAKYLRLGVDDRELDEAMREECDATPEPPQITETELDYFFGEKKP